MSDTETDTLLEIPQLAESPAPAASEIEAALALDPGPDAPAGNTADGHSPAPNAGQFGTAARPGNTAPGPRGARDPERWSRNKMRNATKKELHERIEQLQDRQPPPASVDGRAPAAGEVQTPAIDPSLLVGPLVETFRTTFELLAVALGKHWLADDKELRKLAEAWAPIAAHHAPRAGEYLPWLMAIGTTAGVVAPKVRLTLAETVEPGKPAADAAPPPPTNRDQQLAITD